MMKILFFKNSQDNFDPNAGGVQRITRVLADELSNHNIRSYFLSMNPRDNEVNIYRENEFILPTFPIDSVENTSFLKSLLKEYDINILINQDGFNSPTLRLLKEIKPYVKVISVHHNCVKCLYEKYSEIFKNNRSKVVVQAVESLNLWKLVLLSFRIRQKVLWSKMLKYSDAVVLYFDAFVDELKSLTGVESDKIHVIPNPAPFDFIKREDKINNRIVYVGRIVKTQKRIDRLLSLWHRLHNNLPDWEFDMVGEGTYLQIAKEYAIKHNLERINFHGKSDPLPFWDRADIFTLTSDFEGYGMVLIEAQSRGVIPIANNCFSAMDKVVSDGDTGVIVDDYNIDKMYDEVISMATNQDKFYKFRKQCFTKREVFAKEKIGKEWINLFKSIIA